MRRILFIIVFLSLSQATFGQITKYKGLFIFKFLQSMEWPQSKSSEVYVVSIMGDPALLSQLKNITAERQVNGRSIKVLPYSKNQSLQDINILFISKNKAKNFEALKDEALTNSIVLITESDGLAEAGASINFKMLDERLNFDLNQTSFKKANVVVSEAIKKLATLVE